MGAKIIKYSFVAIGAYLAFKFYTGASKDADAAANGAEGVIKSFQGR